MTKPEIEITQVAAAAGLSYDDAAIIQTVPRRLLLAIAEGSLDMVRLAKAELAAQGAGRDGRWVGFEVANETWLGSPVAG